MLNSQYRKTDCVVDFPEFSDERIMMMPILLGSCAGTPEQYHPLLRSLFDEAGFDSETGYLTIDEQHLNKGQTLRRPGLHVDGYYHGKCGAWGGGGPWASVGRGMLIVSNTAHCQMFSGMIDGEPGPEGECEHLVMPDAGELSEPNRVYWADGACVHESLPMQERTDRQFVRLSLPSNGPWFEGYTENPTGIKPAAEILPARNEFMALLNG